MADKYEKLELRDLVAKLREDLQAVADDGADKNIKFKVEAIDVELKVVAKQTGKGTTGVKFWIANAEVSGEMQDEQTQSIKLRLVPNLAQPKADGSKEFEMSQGQQQRPR